MFHKKLSRRTTIQLGLVLAAVTFTSACTIWREEAANRLATPANMMKRQIDTGDFTLVTYDRIAQRNSVATIYIEGDGVLPLSESNTPFLVPAHTPDYPAALHLATRDRSANIIYLARPCQFTTPNSQTACSAPNSHENRFSPEYLDAMDRAISTLKNQYNFTGFNLVGYEGGGQMAVLLGALRDDVNSIRTVSSTLDNQSWTAHNPVQSTNALNAVQVAPDVAHIPQHHFIGAWGDLMNVYNYNTFRRAMGPSTCIRMTEVAEANERDGWVSRWPYLLSLPVNCDSDQ